MRLIKTFLAGLAGLAIFITLMSLLIPSHPKVSRTVLINYADKGKLMDMVSDLHRWKEWHPLLSSAQVTVTYPTGSTAAAKQCEVDFNGKKARISIDRTDSSVVSFTMKADGERDISNQLYFTVLPGLSQIRVDWLATAHLKWYPWHKFYAIFIDKLTGPGYEQALDALKKKAESLH